MNTADHAVIAERKVHTYGIRRAGRNPSIATTEEDLWDEGGDRTYIVAGDTGGSTVELFHSTKDINDKGKSIVYEGLGLNFDLKTATVALDGTDARTKTSIGTGWSRLFRGFVAKGSVGLLGDLFAYETDTVTGGEPDTTTKKRLKIVQGEDETLMAIYTVPLGYRGRVVGLQALHAANQDLTARLRMRENESSAWRSIAIWSVASGVIGNLEIAVADEIEAGSDVRMTGILSAGSGAVGGQLELVFEKL